jgi:hypothetical protein
MENGRSRGKNDGNSKRVGRKKKKKVVCFSKRAGRWKKQRKIEKGRRKKENKN